jgi:hypothetical protein
MADNAALLVDEILPPVDMRQWVISFPFQLRFLFASKSTRTSFVKSSQQKTISQDKKI